MAPNPSGPKAVHDTRSTDRAFLALCLAVLSFAILYPTVRLVWSALEHWSWDALRTGAGYRAVVNTALISFATVIAAGVVGTGLAFLLTRYSFPGSRPLSALAYLPFTLPPLVGVLGFYYLIGTDGFIPRILEHGLGIDGMAIKGAWGILIIHTYSFYVFFYAMVSAALDGLDVSQIEAARTLGAKRVRVFFQVTVPLIRPALLGAALLTFMTSGASFSAPLFFGQNFPVLSVEIYEARNQFREAEALTLTLVLACVSLLGIILFRSRGPAGGAASKGVRAPIHSQTGRVAASVLSWLIMAILLIPHMVIIYLSFIDHREWHTEVLPAVFTVENYTVLFEDPRTFAPMRNSLWMSGLAAVAALFVGLPAAYLIARRRQGGRLVNFLVMIPWALPGTVIAMNLIVAFNEGWLPLYTTVWILPLAYFVRSLPLFTRMASAAIESFDATLIEAGRTLGARPAYCFFHIVLPLLAPAVVAATALVFATSLGEFVASILLYRTNNEPISMQIFESWRGSGIGSAFAYSVFLMLLVGATFAVSRRFASRVL